MLSDGTSLHPLRGLFGKAAFVAFGIACLAFPLEARSQNLTSSDDMSMGNARARVVITEYASPTCPSCADWRDRVFPEVRREFIETGRVLFVLKETPSHNKTVDAAIFAIARCAGYGKYFEVVDAAFRQREQLDAASRGKNGPRQAIITFAAEFALTGARLDACLDDPATARRLAALREEAIRKGVTGTPTLFINDVPIADRDALDPQRMLDVVRAALATAR